MRPSTRRVCRCRWRNRAMGLRHNGGLLGLVLLFCAGPALAQGIPRLKVRITAFDGQTMTLVGVSSTDVMSVKLLPTTQLVRQEKRSPGDIRINDYIGATLTRARDGTYAAQEVHIFPE